MTDEVRRSRLKHATRRIMVWLLLAAAIALLVSRLAYLATIRPLPTDDFVAYWSAGRLNVTGGNPYSPEQLWPLQRAAGWSLDRPDMIWVPPWTLTLMMPFGVLSYPVGRVVWLLLSLAVVLFCCDWIWRTYGGLASQRWLAPVVGLTFVPTILALRMGQISPLILLGIVGFLHFERRQKWFWAGASTALVAIKPQLLFLFWIALLFWSVERRRWPVIFGVSLACLAATAIPFMVNPAVIGQYIAALVSYPPDYWATPTLGALLRLLFGAGQFWLQFVPPAVGTAWFLLYWRRHRATWDWSEQMPWLLLASLVATAHGWEYDQVVLLLVVVPVAVGVLGMRRAMTAFWIVCVYLAVDGLALLLNLLHSPAFFYIWLAPALLSWYWIARKQTFEKPAT